MLLEKNFIASAVGLRTISMTFDLDVAYALGIITTDENTGKLYIPAGSYYVNDGEGSSDGLSGANATRKGIVLDDVYFKQNKTKVVSALIVAGHILSDKLPKVLDSDVVYELAGQGLFFEASAETVVPEDEVIVDSNENVGD